MSIDDLSIISFPEEVIDDECFLFLCFVLSNQEINSAWSLSDRSAIGTSYSSGNGDAIRWLDLCDFDDDRFERFGADPALSLFEISPLRLFLLRPKLMFVLRPRRLVRLEIGVPLSLPFRFTCSYINKLLVVSLLAVLDVQEYNTNTCSL